MDGEDAVRKKVTYGINFTSATVRPTMPVARSHICRKMSAFSSAMSAFVATFPPMASPTVATTASAWASSNPASLRAFTALWVSNAKVVMLGIMCRTSGHVKVKALLVKLVFFP